VSHQVRGSLARGGKREPVSHQVRGSLARGGKREPVSHQVRGSLARGGKREPVSHQVRGSLARGGKREPVNHQVRGSLARGGKRDRALCRGRAPGRPGPLPSPALMRTLARTCFRTVELERSVSYTKAPGTPFRARASRARSLGENASAGGSGPECPTAHAHPNPGPSPPAGTSRPPSARQHGPLAYLAFTAAGPGRAVGTNLSPARASSGHSPAVPRPEMAFLGVAPAPRRGSGRGHPPAGPSWRASARDVERGPGNPAAARLRL
jgi:hypothetical protein